MAKKRRTRHHTERLIRALDLYREHGIAPTEQDELVFVLRADCGAGRSLMPDPDFDLADRLSEVRCGA